MTLSPMTIKAKKSSQRKRVRVGRGNASGKGNYSARGMKGQRARSGGKGGLRQLGFKAQLQKVPKSRGFNSIAIKPQAVSLGQLEKLAEKYDVITLAILKKERIISRVQSGAKVISNGILTKKLTLKNILATKTALQAIEKVGGTIEY